MNLDQSHERVWPFVGLMFVVALFGLVVAIRSFVTDGAWTILGVAALLGEALLVYGMWIEPRRLTVRRYREALVQNPATWVRIVFLSDLHTGGRYPREWWERMAIETQALAPDVIMLGGDYVVDRAEPIKELAPFAKLQAPLGKYFVLGNHDYIDKPHHVRAMVCGFGFQDLTHRSVVVTHEGHDIEIHGLDDQWYGTMREFQRKAASVPHVLISHEPDVLLDLKEGDTDLVLSGHTHGGQVRIPFVGPLWIPAKLGRAVDAGRKRMNGVTMIISNGLGQTRFRPRLFSPPQIVVVEVGI